MSDDVLDLQRFAKCKGCGKRIFFVKTNEGKTIPIDPSPPIYCITGSGTAVRESGSFVTHFATCSKANEFSGGRRKK